MVKNSARKRAVRAIVEETGLTYTQAATLNEARRHAAAKDLQAPETRQESIDTPAG